MIGSSRALVFVLVVIGSAQSYALPPFARKYGMSCGTCHTAGPTKLSSFGEAFRDNGYRLPGENASFLREAAMPLGDPSRSVLFPRAVFPGEIPGWVPLGINAMCGLLTTIPSGQRATLQIDASVRLLAGGSLGRHFSFLGVVQAGIGGVSLDESFLVIRSLFERWIGEATLNFKIGRYRADLLAIQPNLERAILLPYIAALTVGRDGFTLDTPDEAIEAYGLLGGRAKWVIGIANGVKPLDAANARRDLFARFSTKLGGERLDYRGATTADERTSVVLGASAYWGESVTEPPAPDSRFSSQLLRVTGDARLRSHGFDLLGEVELGSDSNVDGMGTGVRHIAWQVSAEAPVVPWLFPYARFEEVRFDGGTLADRRRLVFGTAAYIRPNIRFRCEGAAGLTAREPHVIAVQLSAAL